MITISFNLNNFNFLKLATSRLSDGPTLTELEEEKTCGYMNVRKYHQQVSPSVHLELSVTNPRRLCREGDDIDFFRASLPGSLGDLVGHGVRGT